MNSRKSRPADKDSLPMKTSPVFLESLEARIAPASLAGIDYKAITLGSPQLLHAGEGLSTSSGSGSYILAVEKGQALVYTTDLNGNNTFDPGEITGIAAGDGLKLTSFVDINGDIVTNLQSDGNLSDSDGDASNGRDGLLLLNSKIDGITLRSVTAADLSSGDTVGNRLILSSYSIHGNIYAGGGMGVSGSAIVIDTVGLAAQVAKFSGTSVDYQVGSIIPSLGTIKIGTAASGEYFNFGYYTVANGSMVAGDLQAGGMIKTFTPGIGQAGGDFVGLKVGDNADATVTTSGTDGTATSNFKAKAFTIDAIIAGDGGIGAKGGDIRNVTFMGDTGGLRVIAGDGGKGVTGGNGGAIVNLADLGSVNGVVEIRTGSGGEGFLGNAGSAGSLSFGEFLMNGDISIGLGNGGNALVNAGNGTSLTQASFKPTDAGGLSTAVAVVSSYHDIGEVGSMQLIDFDKDGYTDIVYLTNSPDQLAVKFGTAAGIYDFTPTLYFAAPTYSPLEDGSSAIVVADFNDDGFLDIATASSTANSSDGIRVFLNPGDGTGDDNGWKQAAYLEDGGNYIDASIRSALPTLNPYGFLRSGAAISDLAAGDFNGDGDMDLAIVSQSFVYDGGPKKVTTIEMLTGTNDGRFFADFAYNRTTSTQSLMPLITSGGSVTEYNGHGEFVIKATAADANVIGNAKEVLVAMESGNVNNKSVNLIQFENTSFAIVDSELPTYDVAKIDNNLITGWNTKTGTPVDLSITDVLGDGIFDVVVLDQEKAVTVFGGTANGLTFASNQGVILIGEKTLLGDSKADFKSAIAGSFGGASDSQFALYSNGTGDTPTAFFQFDLAGFNLHGAATYTADLTKNGDPVKAPYPGVDDFNEDIIAFDIFNNASNATEFGYVSALPTTTRSGFFEGVSSLLTNPVGFDLSTNQITLVTGNGGDSYLGSGGSGGVVGSGSVSVSDTTGVTGAFNVVLPADRALQPDVIVRGGSGGSGFINGGVGGGVRGIAVTYVEEAGVLAADIFLHAGNGGAGLTGTGGAGGSLSSLHVQTGETFFAGDGGFGFRGGKGGSVENAYRGIDGQTDYSTYNSVVYVFTGAGGLGIAAGGSGGNISGFSAEFAALVGGVGGQLQYATGGGGDAVAGTAGAGGSIVNSSPISTNNNLVGPIILRTGNGGNGLTGGSGGNITGFKNLSTVSSPVTLVSVVAGNGGTGVTGAGGNGGTISSFTASGTGVSGAYQYNRVIAGDGGDSYGATGGTGGSLTTILTTAGSSATAVAAGAGGDGLTRGGNGGSITGTEADSAAGVAAKVIVIAGSGGSAFSALATASNVGDTGDIAAVLNLRAFGGTNGIGGNGGNITNFTQPKTTQAAVDLIAGNGGSLINYGSSANATTSVGKGGSLSGITLAGEAGRVDETVAIKSYAADFVQNVLRDNPSVQLSDSVGNVGVIAGIAGRVKGDLPAGDASQKTGSVTNFTASSIMSMVAGSVDRIAAINTISGIKLTDVGGVLGAYKTTPVGPSPSHSETLPLYYSGANQTGATVAAPVLGGSLMDGAVVVQNNNSGLAASRLFVL